MIRIFSFLREPIIPFAAYHTLVSRIIEDNIDLKVVQSVLSDLPPINQNNLYCLLHFMKTQVVSRDKLNKMTSYNIAAVLMPCLMRSENPLTDVVYAKKCVKIVEFMIINC